MNEAQTNVALAALEKQRNNALNQVVNIEVALTITQAKLAETEKELQKVTDQLRVATQPQDQPKEAP